MARSKANAFMSPCLTFSAGKGKVIVRLRGNQCTIDAEEALKAGHDLISKAEKALRRAGRIHEES